MERAPHRAPFLICWPFREQRRGWRGPTAHRKITFVVIPNPRFLRVRDLLLARSQEKNRYRINFYVLIPNNSIKFTKTSFNPDAFFIASPKFPCCADPAASDHTCLARSYCCLALCNFS